MYNYLVLPTADDIRGARAFLNWKQISLAHKCDVNPSTLTAIENEKSKPTKELLEIIAKVFLEAGIKFNTDGGFSINKNVATIYEGNDCFLKVQEDILNTCSINEEEVLMIGNDDRKCDERIIGKDKELFKAGIYFKSLVEKGNNYLIGPIEDYRSIDACFFVPASFTIIYGNKVAFDLWEEKKDKKIQKIIVLQENIINQNMRKYFNYLWEMGKEINKSTTKQLLFKNEK